MGWKITLFSWELELRSGVAVLIKNDVDCIIHSRIVDPSGHYLILKVVMEDNSYILTNMHLIEIKISLYFFETY